MTIQQNRIETVPATGGHDDQPPARFHNHYHCTACSISWDDVWDSMCDDPCPVCETAYTPVESREIA